MNSTALMTILPRETAIGIRETGFGTQSGGGNNVYQITITSTTPAARVAQLGWASQWVAGTLSTDYNSLLRHGVSGSALLDDTFDAYNAGLTRVLNNLGHADSVTAHGNYGPDVSLLLKCF